MTDAPTHDLDALVAQLEAQAQERRDAGVYPPGIEDELRDEFARRLRAAATQTTELRAAQQHAHAAGMFELRPYTGDNRVKIALSKAVEKAVGYALIDIIGQLNSYRAGLDRLFDALIDRVEPQAGALGHDLAEVRERVSALERRGRTAQAADVPAQLEELLRRVDRRGFSPFYDGARFEEAFRGPVDNRYDDVARRFQGQDPVLDMGCGRGELLGVLQRFEVPSWGVDIDPDAVADALAAGHQARSGDGLEVMGGVADASLGGVLCVQVVEHLGPQGVLDFVELCGTKLRPGGLVYVETVNPRSLCVYANAMYADPTHTQPIHPDYLQFLFREAGFSDVAVEWRSPVSDDDRLPQIDDDGTEATARLRQVIEQLNGLLYGPQDYAVTARR